MHKPGNYASTYFVSMHSERATNIRTRLLLLQDTLWERVAIAKQHTQESYHAQTPTTPSQKHPLIQAEYAYYNIWKQLEGVMFRLSLVTPPACKFCGSTYGLTPELDYRNDVTLKQAIRAGTVTCCGNCYAHVLFMPSVNRKG